MKYCGNSSVGRARPCQGRGREFESRFPLQTPRSPTGRFCYALAGWPFPACCLQTSFVQENILRPAFSCTSLTDLADCRPDSERLEQKTPEGSVFRCTNEICTSQYQLHRTFSPGRYRPWCRWGRETGIVSSGDRARSVTVLRSDLYTLTIMKWRVHSSVSGSSGKTSSAFCSLEPVVS